MEKNCQEIVRSRSPFASRFAREFVSSLRLAGERMAQGYIKPESIDKEATTFDNLFLVLRDLVSPERRELLDEAIAQQIRLPDDERAAIFGRLATVSLSEPDAFASDSFFETLAAEETMLRLLATDIDSYQDATEFKEAPRSERSYTSLEFRISQVRVISTEDWTGADEVQLTLTTIDETGDVGKGAWEEE